jgi:uncharacterized protein (TIGR03437 family)
VKKNIPAVLSFASALAFGQSVETIPYRAVISPANEVPAITDVQGSGAVNVWLHLVKDASGRVTSGSVDFEVRYSGLSPNQTFTAMHIHSGAAGVNGPVVIDARLQRTDAAPGGGVLPAYQAQLTTPAQLAAAEGILADPSQYYFNIHSVEKPGGIMRGQLQLAEMTVLMAQMTPANEVPAVTGPNAGASAVGTAILLITRAPNGQMTSGYVLFDIAYRDLTADTIFTAMHIHRGAAGVNGPVVLDSAMSRTEVASGGAGVLRFDNEMNIANAAVRAALEDIRFNANAFYLNVHSVANPGGILRGQTRFTDRMNFQFNASPANEVPPVTGIAASAPGAISIHTLRNPDGSVAAGAAFFDIHPRLPEGSRITAMHIHDQVAGQNGPVTIDARFAAFPNLVPESGSGNIFRIVTTAAASAVSALNSLVQNPERHYFNLHTQAHPGGVVRAQLAEPNTALPSIAAMISGISDPTRRSAANFGLVSLFGANLAKVATNLNAVVPTRTVPTSLNGVEVTVAGVPAALLFVSPNQVNFQVPNVAQGAQPVVVRNPNGVSAAVNLDVAASAPAIFFDTAGAIAIRNSDFTPVRPESPAAAGEIVLLYSTGLGSTTPGLAPGVIAGGPPFHETAPVTVTIGGRDAPVIYSIASPGFIGLYQTAVRVPAGLSAGPNPVVMRQGQAVSNSVPIAIR